MNGRQHDFYYLVTCKQTIFTLEGFFFVLRGWGEWLIHLVKKKILQAMAVQGN